MYNLLWRKVIFSVTVLLVSASALQAQFGREMYREDHDDKPYYFGMSLSATQHSINHTKDRRFIADDSVLQAVPGFSPSFNLGLLATWHPTYRWELRFNPQLMLGVNRSFNYFLGDKYVPGAENLFVKKTIQSTIVSFPLSVKFNSDRINNFRVYMIGGAQVDMDLASNSQARNAEDMLKLKRYDFGLHCGLGFNFFLPFVTVSPELKVVSGLSNLHSRSNDLKYSAVLDKFQSRMMVLSIILEE